MNAYQTVGLDFHVHHDDSLTVEIKTKPFTAADAERVKAEFHAIVDEAFKSFASAWEAGALSADGGGNAFFRRSA